MSQIYLKKTDAMRRLVHLVSHGYTRYTTGTVSPAKAEGLALKFLDRYRIDRDSQQRWRAKKGGEANSHLVMWPEGESIRWWLLVTGSGSGLVTQLEELQHAGTKRGRIQLTGYEVIKMPREGKSADWTWRMTGETEQAWRDRFHLAITHRNDQEMRQCLHSLGQCPGFSEVRRQAYGVHKHAVAEWQRHRSEPWPYAENLGMKFFGRRQKALTADVKDIKPARKKRTRLEAGA